MIKASRNQSGEQKQFPENENFRSHFLFGQESATPMTILVSICQYYNHFNVFIIIIITIIM
mgnify:CR=1 FL=1